jgi:hypothetical protein
LALALVESVRTLELARAICSIDSSIATASARSSIRKIV